jgi:hypothetical protein
MNRGQPDVLDEALDAELRPLLASGAARLNDEGDADPVAARQVVRRFRAREQRRRAAVVALSALSLAAAALLTLRLRAPDRAPQPHLTVAPTGPISRYTLQRGSAATVVGRALEKGRPLEAATVVLRAGACIEGRDARLCAAAPGGARLSLPAVSDRQLVTLQEGGVIAEVFTAETGFVVATLHGDISAKSALFTLALDQSRAFTLVAVSSGSVRYRDLQAAEAALFQGQSVRLGLEPSESTGERASAVTPGAPQPALVRAVPSAPSSATSAASAGELLELARQERAARHYSAAALAYRRLEQTFPDSAEARAALVSLGQLELGQLGQPEAALRSFRAYLAAPGQLQQEAEHGSILALQKLGRTAEERAAIEAFIARYPKSVQAIALKQRLEQL